MKLIALEEHYLTPEIRAAWTSAGIDQRATGGFDDGAMGTRLDDLGSDRIRLMDEAGIDVQVLSVTTPALSNLAPDRSVDLARRTNDLVAAVITRHPARFQAFATLPTPSPADAAAELERSVRTLGLKGAMLCGRTRDKHLDHPDFQPLLQTAASLGVPLYLHPQIPQQPVRDALYSGFGEEVDHAFAAFGIGWHFEAGIQFVRLILAGTFDRHPGLQIILGHWGEVVLFYLERLGSLGRFARLERPVTDYFRHNLYVTPSGMWSQSYLQRALEVVGPERIMFSQDFPYRFDPARAGRSFVDDADLSHSDRELFAHGNWERLTQNV